MILCFSPFNKIKKWMRILFQHNAIVVNMVGKNDQSDHPITIQNDHP